MFRLQKSIGADGSALVRPRALQNVHPTYDSLMLLDMGRDFKEAVSRVAETPLVESDPRFCNLPTTLYELPDGTVLDLGVERFQLTEALFDPSVVDVDCADMAALGYTTWATSSSGNGNGNGRPALVREGVARLVSNSIVACDMEVQTSLCHNVVVAGGGSAVEGLPERVKLDVETVVHAMAPGLRIRTAALGVSERALTAWLGGSIVASLGSFHEMWLTRQEYDEFGAGIVEKKCP
jgi:actin-related protein